MTPTGLAKRQTSFPSNGWEDRHDKAWGSNIIPHLFPPSCERDGKIYTERAMVAMLKGWKAMAEGHQAQHGSKIGEDYFLGPLWLEIGKSLRGLLNGEIGRLDGGTVDGFILSTLKAAGFTESDL